jgi:HlyD family secretion protein
VNGSKRNLLIGIGGAGALVCLALFIMLFWKKGTANASAKTEESRTTGAQDESGVPRVKAIRPKAGGIERLCVQPATVESFDYVDIFAQVPGILDKQEVDIDWRVKKGQPLAEIVAPEFVAERDHAQSLLDQSNAKVKQAEAHKVAARAMWEAAKSLVNQRRAAVLAAKSYLEFRHKQFERFKQLAERNAIQMEIVDEESDRLDAALSRRDAAVADVAVAEADVASKEANYKEAEADLEAAQANVKVATTALAKAQVFVDYTKVVAPFDGVITARNFNNGAFIRTVERGGQVPLLRINRTDVVRIIVQVPDNDAPFIHKDDPAELKVFTLGKVFQGKIARTGHRESQSSRTMRVEMDLKSNDVLMDGMYGEVTIHVKNLNSNALSIPSTCLIQGEVEGGKRRVFVVRTDQAGKKIARSVAVRVSYDNGTLAEVIQGLRPDDQVIAERASIEDGMVVEVAE